MVAGLADATAERLAKAGFPSAAPVMPRMKSRLNIDNDVIIDVTLVNKAEKLSHGLSLVFAQRLAQTSLCIREKQRLASPFECADMGLPLGG